MSSPDNGAIGDKAPYRIDYRLRTRSLPKLPMTKAIKGVWSLIRFVLVFGISFVILYPILQKISTAFKHKDDIYNPVVIWVPEHFTMDNIRNVIRVMDYGQALLGSFILSGSVMVLLAVSCALAGYAFAKLNKFRGSGLLFGIVVFTIVVPPQTIMLPSYMNFKDFDLFGLIGLFNGGKGLSLLDTYWPFVISAVTGMGIKSGLFIYILRQFFRGLPKEIEEAALVDGAGIFKTFTSIMLPNAVPALVTVMLFAFVWQWNDSFFTSLYLTNAKIVATMLANLPTSTESFAMISSGLKMDRFYVSMLVNAGTLLAIAPLIIMYMFVQRYFVESVERTGVVG